MIRSLDIDGTLVKTFRYFFGQFVVFEIPLRDAVVSIAAKANMSVSNLMPTNDKSLSFVQTLKEMIFIVLRF